MAAGGGIRIQNVTVRGGADGKTPQFKLEDGILYNSYDNGRVWHAIGMTLPVVTEDDNGKTLKVVNGKWVVSN